VPVCDAEGKRFDGRLIDVFVQAHDKGTGSDRVDSTLRDCPRFDGNAEVESELQEEFIKNVLLVAIFFEVVDAVEDGLVDIFGLGIPRTYVGCIEAEYPEVQISVKECEFIANAISCAPESLLRQLCYHMPFADGVTLSNC
jgi:hypothetical protein